MTDAERKLKEKTKTIINYMKQNTYLSAKTVKQINYQGHKTQAAVNIFEVYSNRPQVFKCCDSAHGFALENVQVTPGIPKKRVKV